LVLCQLRPSLEVFLEALAGLGRKGLRLALGLRDDGVRLILGLAALALVVGKELLGLLAQAARLVELAADRVGAVVERLRDQAGNLVVDEQADEAEEGDSNPELGRCEDRHGGYSPGTGSRARRASS